MAIVEEQIFDIVCTSCDQLQRHTNVQKLYSILQVDINVTPGSHADEQSGDSLVVPWNPDNVLICRSFYECNNTDAGGVFHMLLWKIKAIPCYGCIPCLLLQEPIKMQ